MRKNPEFGDSNISIDLPMIPRKKIDILEEQIIDLQNENRIMRKQLNNHYNKQNELNQTIFKLENRKYWNTLDPPVALGTLNFNNCNRVQSFSIPKSIDIKYNELLINVVLRSGKETPYSWYHVDVWTVTENGNNHKNMKRIRGWHTAQSAIAFNSENMWFPFDSDMKLYYLVKDTPHSNCHGGEVQIIGYR
eukprot:190811_1